MDQASKLINVKDASLWASEHLGKHVSMSNISYLIQYGRIKKYSENGSTLVSKQELEDYYKSYNGSREISWRNQLGDDLNWALSFDNYKEAETTKHVHRLHPYKGKFIPQLVEYFLDSHTDNFKHEVFFKPGDLVLDPFCGSGTTLVQANELGIHAIGVDVSAFNSLISTCKINKYDLNDVQKEVNRITQVLELYLTNSHTLEFENELLEELYKFNNLFFPVPEYKFRVRNRLIDEKSYSAEKAQEFLRTYNRLLERYDIELLKSDPKNFLEKWFIQPVLKEIDVVFQEIKKISNRDTKKIIAVILSRTIRSCRATTHSDLATLFEPMITTYYCTKHGKICKPIFSILKWWNTYTKDTIKRLRQFDALRTNTHQVCVTGDSRNIDLLSRMQTVNPDLYALLNSRGIDGIFSSPPYVGLIDYHEQHAYAYDLFGFERNDELEIGPLYRGQGRDAKNSYVQGVSDVLLNSKKYLAKDYNVFLVANDKYNLYPTIAEKSGMMIVNQYKRPVLNRTEKDKGAYSETIFHIKER